MCAILAFLLAATACEPTFEVEADHSNCLYRAGERVEFSVRVKGGGELLRTGLVRVKLDAGGPGLVLTNRVFDLAQGNPFTVSAVRTDEGSVRLRMSVDGQKGETLYGVLYDWEKIRPLSVRPADFDAYWKSERQRFDRTVKGDVEQERDEARSDASRTVYRISCPTFNGKRVYGFLSVPVGQGPFPVRVAVGGAGPGSVSATPPKGWVGLTMNVHCYRPGRTVQEENERYEAWMKEIKARYGTDDYLAVGMRDGRDGYILHDPILGMLRILDWLVGQPYVDRERLTYFGSSQGGAFGFYLMGLGPRFARAFLNVPAMADLLAYRHGRATSGYNRLLWRNPAAAMPAVEAACAYYDTAHFAPLVRTPLRVVVGLSDDVCPFITGIAAFNCTASDDRRLYAVPGMRHVYGTPHNGEINAWLTGCVR